MTPDLWHYTSGSRWHEIRRTGVILPAIAGVPPGERPCVWFSTRPTFEPTAIPGIIKGGVRVDASFEDLETAGGGAFRIGVSPEVAPHNWGAYKKLSNVAPSMARGLERAARNKGANVGHWRVSFEPVERDKWVRVQRLVGGTWFDEEMAAAQLAR